jgi:hypothetical protein
MKPAEIESHLAQLARNAKKCKAIYRENDRLEDEVIAALNKSGKPVKLSDGSLVGLKDNFVDGNGVRGNKAWKSCVVKHYEITVEPAIQHPFGRQPKN